jgi:predicted dehydrogenase
MPNSSASPVAQPIKVAVVGLGFMGATHLRAYLKNTEAEVVAVCGLNRLPINGVLPGVAGNIQNAEDVILGPGVKVYRQLEDLLADPEVQLVDICTPTALHPRQTIAALNAGKHVLCEKPLARTSAAAREILRAAERSQGFLMPAMCMRFWPGWNSLKKVVADNTYGKTHAARFYRLSARPSWGGNATYATESGNGGALYDLHIHDNDFINHLFGRPAGVFSRGTASKAGVIEHVVTQYIYPNGLAVHAEGSWLLKQGFAMGFTVHCERATLDFDSGRGAGALVITEEDQPPRTIQLEDTDGYLEEIRYFVGCISQNSAPKVVAARDGLTALEICEAEEKSIHTGQMTNV